MKTSRFLGITGGVISLAAVLVVVVSARWGNSETVFQNAPKLLSALQVFSREQVAAGRPLPPEASLQDLVRGGYLTASDVAAFAGMDVRFNTQAQDDNPQMIVARASTRDGLLICLLADGSVQQLSRERYEQQRATLGEPGGAANPLQAATAPATDRTGVGQPDGAVAGAQLLRAQSDKGETTLVDRAEAIRIASKFYRGMPEKQVCAILASNGLPVVVSRLGGSFRWIDVYRLADGSDLRLEMRSKDGRGYGSRAGGVLDGASIESNWDRVLSIALTNTP